MKNCSVALSIIFRLSFHLIFVELSANINLRNEDLNPRPRIDSLLIHEKYLRRSVQNSLDQDFKDSTRFNSQGIEEKYTIPTRQKSLYDKLENKRVYFNTETSKDLKNKNKESKRTHKSLFDIAQLKKKFNKTQREHLKDKSFTQSSKFKNIKSVLSDLKRKIDEKVKSKTQKLKDFSRRRQKSAISIPQSGSIFFESQVHFKPTNNQNANEKQKNGNLVEISASKKKISKLNRSMNHFKRRREKRMEKSLQKKTFSGLVDQTATQENNNFENSRHCNPQADFSMKYDPEVFNHSEDENIRSCSKSSLHTSDFENTGDNLTKENTDAHVLKHRRQNGHEFLQEILENIEENRNSVNLSIKEPRLTKKAPNELKNTKIGRRQLENGYFTLETIEEESEPSNENNSTYNESNLDEFDEIFSSPKNTFDNQNLVVEQKELCGEDENPVKLEKNESSEPESTDFEIESRNEDDKKIITDAEDVCLEERNLLKYSNLQRKYKNEQKRLEKIKSQSFYNSKYKKGSFEYVLSKMEPNEIVLAASNGKIENLRRKSRAQKQIRSTLIELETNLANISREINACKNKLEKFRIALGTEEDSNSDNFSDFYSIQKTKDKMSALEDEDLSNLFEFLSNTQNESDKLSFDEMKRHFSQ